MRSPFRLKLSRRCRWEADRRCSMGLEDMAHSLNAGLLWRRAYQPVTVPRQGIPPKPLQPFGLSERKGRQSGYYSLDAHAAS